MIKEKLLNAKKRLIEKNKKEWEDLQPEEEVLNAKGLSPKVAIAVAGFLLLMLLADALYNRSMSKLNPSTPAVKEKTIPVDEYLEQDENVWNKTVWAPAKGEKVIAGKKAMSEPDFIKFATKRPMLEARRYKSFFAMNQNQR